jgi:hypothetical protein
MQELDTAWLVLTFSVYASCWCGLTMQRCSSCMQSAIAEPALSRHHCQIWLTASVAPSKLLLGVFSDQEMPHLVGAGPAVSASVACCPLCAVSSS